MTTKQKPVEQGCDDANLTETPIPPCNIVIFGATGDLTHRKLMPALFSIDAIGVLPDTVRIVGFARREYTDESYRDEIKRSIQKFAPEIWAESAEHWDTFQHRIAFHRSDFDNPRGFQSLKERLEANDEKYGTAGNRLYYMATPPSQYIQLIHALRDCGLATRTEPGGPPHPFNRIIVEKPFGSDLDSAKALNNELKSVLDESQIYRIDHYLGKETVQNIFVFRFANAIFEPIWNHKYVDNIQITVAETVGVENRAGYFDHAGELRDMVQSHAMQLLTLVAMEPPVSMDATSIRDEKVKVLRGLRTLTGRELADSTVRGRYTAGYLDGQSVPGYHDEPGVAPDSRAETFVALRLSVDNWRWAGVPFYVRAGKRLPKRITEINIQFKNIPAILLAHMDHKGIEPNVLTIRIQPDEGITMRLGAKPPGPKMAVAPVDLDFTYGTSFGQRIRDAYERLLVDALIGDAALFTRDDEVEAEWAYITPILKAWECSPATDVFPYAAGTWGPDDSSALVGDVHPKRRWVER